MDSTIQTAPDNLLRAYAKLIDRSFLYFRNHSHLGDEKSQEKAHDLADAMHNISGIIADYGFWTDDEKYREIYLRPFDRKWGDEGFHFENLLDYYLSPDSDVSEEAKQ